MADSTENSGKALWGSLIKRLVLVIAAVMLLVTVGAYVGISQHEKDTLYQGKAAAARMVVSLFASSSAPAVVFGDDQALKQSISDLARNADVIDVEVWSRSAEADDKSTLLGNFHREHVGEAGKRQAPATSAYRSSLVFQDENLLVTENLADAQGRSIGLVRVTFSLSPEKAAVAQTTRRILWISSVVALGAVLVLVMAVGRSLLQPMRELRMARELEIASNIQMAMLPKKPEHPDFEFAGKMLPADEVGGDFFDVLVSEQRLWITVGDVSGHGLGAGLIMLMVQSAFAAQFRAQPSALPNNVMSSVNELLWENITERLKENKYVTCQLLAYTNDGDFRVAGGHQFPLVFRAKTKQIETIHVAGPWLGILRSWPDAPGSEVHLEPGDVMCLYTDGSIEARNAAGELWDTPRFSDALRDALSKYESLEKAIDHVFASLFAFCPKPDDDVSLLLVRRR